MLAKDVPGRPGVDPRLRRLFARVLLLATAGLCVYSIFRVSRNGCGSNPRVVTVAEVLDGKAGAGDRIELRGIGDPFPPHGLEFTVVQKSSSDVWASKKETVYEYHPLLPESGWAGEARSALTSSLAELDGIDIDAVEGMEGGEGARAEEALEGVSDALAAAYPERYVLIERDRGTETRPAFDLDIGSLKVPSLGNEDVRKRLAEAESQSVPDLDLALIEPRLPLGGGYAGLAFGSSAGNYNDLVERYNRETARRNRYYIEQERERFHTLLTQLDGTTSLDGRVGVLRKVKPEVRRKYGTEMIPGSEPVLMLDLGASPSRLWPVLSFLSGFGLLVLIWIGFAGTSTEARGTR